MQNYKCALLYLITVIAACTCAPCWAQTDTVLVDAQLPDDFDRGQNVSVRDAKRPGYEPLGIALGSTMVFPTLKIGTGVTDNVFRTSQGGRTGYFVSVSPSIKATFKRHPFEVRLNSEAVFEEYPNQSNRDRDTWSIHPSARVFLGEGTHLIVDFRAAQFSEDPFSGEVTPEVTAFSQYRNFVGRLKGVYEAGQFRSTLSLDHNLYRFRPIKLAGEEPFKQDARDRNVTRSAAQIEYAISPSIAFYSAANITGTDFARVDNVSEPERDSLTIQILAGANFDISKLVRGKIGIGYSWQDFDSPIYPDVNGISIEAEIEYFFSPITTFSLEIRRTLRLSTLGSSVPFFDNRAIFSVDHALLRNLIISSNAQIGKQEYQWSGRKADLFGVSLGMDYLISNRFSISGWADFNKRTRMTIGSRQEYDELSARVAFTIHP